MSLCIVHLYTVHTCIATYYIIIFHIYATMDSILWRHLNRYTDNTYGHEFLIHIYNTYTQRQWRECQSVTLASGRISDFQKVHTYVYMKSRKIPGLGGGRSTKRVGSGSRSRKPEENSHALTPPGPKHHFQHRCTRDFLKASEKANQRGNQSPVPFLPQFPWQRENLIFQKTNIFCPVYSQTFHD